jgi:hypothetical protein
MTATGTGPIKRAIVRRLRSSGALRTVLVGGIHQHLARGKRSYPYVVYTEVTAPFIRDWGTGSDQGTREIHALYDIAVYASNPVEAENLDQLIDNLFDGADRELDPLVDGQRVTYCARVATIPAGGPQEDDEGRYYAQVGGTYEIWTEQQISPVSTMVMASSAAGSGAAIGP